MRRPLDHDVELQQQIEMVERMARSGACENNDDTKGGDPHGLEFTPPR